MTDADLPEMLRDENSIIRRYVRTLARYERPGMSDTRTSSGYRA